MSGTRVTGRCLCGAVRWTSGASFTHMFHCHCGLCRKLHGSAQATFVAGPGDSFEWLSPTDTVREFASRPFCGNCGSKLPWVDATGRVLMPAGSLEGDFDLRPQRRVCLRTLPTWFVIADSLPRHDAAPADYPLQCVEVTAPPDRDGVTGGSCACGGVQFELEGPPLVWMNCHCWRCRRSRGTAHASNLGWRLDALRYVRGEDQITVYDLPEARYFGTTFCSRCGGFAPRRSEGRGFNVIPSGALDSDPGVRPSAHQFLSSRAPWFDVTDGLPQFQEAAAKPQPKN